MQNGCTIPSGVTRRVARVASRVLTLSLVLFVTPMSAAQGKEEPPATHPAAAADPMDEPLITDRPDFTESTDAVPAGHLQFELGYTFTYDREGKDRVRSHTAPEILLRIGAMENFEIRIGWEGYSWSDNQFEGETRGGRRVTRDDWSQGAHDLSLGIKYKFLEQDGWVPHFGVIAAMTVPSGSAGVSSGDVDPEVVLLWAYDVTDNFAVAGNVGFGMPNDDGDRFFQTSASLSGAFSLTEKLGAYIEYYGFYPSTEDSDCAHFLNGGLTYLINNNFQIDWRIGAGLNEEADDFYTGVGFAWRF
ncbi:MAG: transporter [Planctomycetes bacterium]|nr:transporter [Planctomycetota bacterium]